VGAAYFTAAESHRAFAALAACCRGYQPSVLLVQGGLTLANTPTPSVSLYFDTRSTYSQSYSLQVKDQADLLSVHVALAEQQLPQQQQTLVALTCQTRLCTAGYAHQEA
jgi:hypothetical protein